jgi:hypothetical protein
VARRYSHFGEGRNGTAAAARYDLFDVLRPAWRGFRANRLGHVRENDLRRILLDKILVGFDRAVA